MVMYLQPNCRFFTRNFSTRKIMVTRHKLSHSWSLIFWHLIFTVEKVGFLRLVQFLNLCCCSCSHSFFRWKKVIPYEKIVSGENQFNGRKNVSYKVCYITFREHSSSSALRYFVNLPHDSDNGKVKLHCVRETLLALPCFFLVYYRFFCLLLPCSYPNKI